MKREELIYLAGYLDAKMHCYILKSGNIQVSLRSQGNLPKILKREFGGFYFRNGNPVRLWYRVQGEKAARLLRLVLPHLKSEAKKARSILESWNERQLGLK